MCGDTNNAINAPVNIRPMNLLWKQPEEATKEPTRTGCVSLQKKSHGSIQFLRNVTMRKCRGADTDAESIRSYE